MRDPAGTRTVRGKPSKQSTDDTTTAQFAGVNYMSDELTQSIKMASSKSNQWGAVCGRLSEIQRVVENNTPDHAKIRDVNTSTYGSSTRVDVSFEIIVDRLSPKVLSLMRSIEWDSESTDKRGDGSRRLYLKKEVRGSELIQ